jgi:tRNA threonylcarbamoyl adenosine modification protein YeaZ
MELSIDTSTAWGGVALSTQGQVTAELTWKPGQNHSVELHPNISRLLETAKADFRSVMAVFVARGPGSYNGLRAGISAAKGIAFSLNIPIVAVSTLEIEAYQFASLGLPICPLHDAGRREFACALYGSQGGWVCLKTEYLTTLEKLCSEISTRMVFCGEIPEAAIARIKEVLGEKAVIPDPVQRIRRPSCLAVLAWQRLQSGQTDNLATLQPIYLRQPPITQRKKKH